MKSWLLLDPGLHLAAGKPWLGKFSIPHPRKVLYVDEEMSRVNM
jgi:RecA-family ATPase